MKKLLNLLIVLILLTGFSINSYAADIVVRTVKIKKRNIPSKSMVNTNACDGKFDVDEMDITTTTENNSKTYNYTNYAFSFPLIATKGLAVSSVTMDITVVDCKGGMYMKTLSCKLNAKTGNYEANYTLTNMPVCPYTLTGAGIDVKNNCEEVSSFEMEQDKTMQQLCDTKYKLKEVNYLAGNQSGMYVMNFDFSMDKGSDVPALVEMIVQLTNCNGQKLNIKIPVSYDASTGLYKAAQGIPQVKDCPWVLTYAEIYTYNPCGEMDTWSITFDQIKTDGAGTRTTASSTKSTRPQLK